MHVHANACIAQYSLLRGGLCCWNRPLGMEGGTQCAAETTTTTTTTTTTIDGPRRLPLTNHSVPFSFLLQTKKKKGPTVVRTLSTAKPPRDDPPPSPLPPHWAPSRPPTYCGVYSRPPDADREGDGGTGRRYTNREPTAVTSVFPAGQLHRTQPHGGWPRETWNLHARRCATTHFGKPGSRRVR